jgi:nucleoside-diphosphate-sugar epimerase
MAVLLTGATGFLGSEILRQLVSSGTEVVALVRDEQAARSLGDAARVVRGSLTDSKLVAEAARSSEGVIHTAAERGPGQAAADDAFVTTVLDALEGSQIPYLHSSGAWVFGAGHAITEDSPYRPPRVTAWRVPIERRVRRSRVRTTIIAPGLIHNDDARGLISMLRPDSTGVVRLISDGTQRWTTVHVADLADLYVRALRAGSDDGYFLGVSACPAVRELAHAAADGAPVVSEEPEETAARVGRDLAEALGLDQCVPTSRALSELGWDPSQISAVGALRRLYGT